MVESQPSVFLFKGIVIEYNVDGICNIGGIYAIYSITTN